MATPSDLPNPSTPLAWLDPALAGQLEVSRYLYVATCGMFSWDILINMRNDWNMLRRHRIRFPIVDYFVSRIAAFSYIISSTAFQIGPVGNCQTLQVALGCCYAVAVPSTSLLFFFRIRAIFNNNRYIVALFAFLWLATLAGSITVPFAIGGGHIGTTNRCINTFVKPFSLAGIIITTINDTMIFLFVTYKLLADTTYDDSWRGRLRSFFKGKGLPGLSRALLQSGQEYYLVTVGFNVLSTAMILAPKTIPPLFHVMFTIPNVAINNAMACRVFRDIKFGYISSTGVTTLRTLPPLNFAVSDSADHTITIGARRQRRHVDTFELRTTDVAFEPTDDKERGVHITTSVEQFSSSDDSYKISLPHAVVVKNNDRS
ncbi:hypothetical protein CPB84DRAFT_1746024 [Gymnopilus junonius]|uniref:Uncharacterized protein n=1 Tax=Gymnopilus junonius TaxID=109634 RepID=A0A9P5TPU8_GYMJU|nr:hypothetical protein CPB84DRAFT_1746024 [Gymnopilus junonius]